MPSLLNPDALHSISVQAQLKNATTAPERGPGDAVEVIEIDPKGITVDCPAKVCAAGHHVLLRIEIDRPGKKQLVFTSTARVKEVEVQSPERSRVSLSFMQFDSVNWQSLCDLLSARQGEISEFLETVRGR